MTRPNSHRQEHIGSLVTSDLRAAYGKRRLEERIPLLLDPDEGATVLAASTIAGPWWKELRVKAAGRLIVVTDKRVLLIPAGNLLEKDPVLGALREGLEALSYREIQRVDESLGRFESKLDLVLAERTIRLSSMRKGAATAVATAVRGHI